MIYLVYGNEQYLVNAKIKELLKKNVNSYLFKFDGSFKNDPIDEVLNTCNNDGLFNNKCIVLYRNPSFLINKCNDEDLIQRIEKYINNPNQNCNLVLYAFYETFNSKLSIFKHILDNSEHFYYQKLDQNRFYDICNDELNNRKLLIDLKTRQYFINNCGCDLSNFYSGLINLINYDGNITKNVIDQLTYSSDDFNIFNLVNSLIAGDSSSSLKYIKKLKYDDDSIFGLISLVASQLRYLYSVYYYSKKYTNEKDILEATKTNNPYKLKMAYKTLNNIKIKYIFKILYRLSSLDYELKSNPDIDHKLLIDLFIANICL